MTIAPIITGFQRRDITLSGRLLTGVIMVLLTAFLTFGAGILGAGAFAAHAHEGKTALTAVLFNPRTGNVEVMHRLSLHDADHAARQLFGAKDIAADKTAQQELADYARARFGLARLSLSAPGSDEGAGQKTRAKPQTAAFALKPVGHEIDGPFFWVYSEAPIPADLAPSFRLVIQNDVFRDLWAEQANLVTIEHGGFRGSARFSGPARQETVTITAPKPVSPPVPQ